MHHFVSALLVLPTITGKEASLMILRWFHFIAGILWIGLLYFFNLVNVPFMKQVDAAAKPKILEKMTLPALHWFRWSAVVTVVMGIGYWMNIVSADSHNAQASPGQAIWSFFLIWTVAFAVQNALVMPVKVAAPVAALVSVTVAAIVVVQDWRQVQMRSAASTDHGSEAPPAGRATCIPRR